MFTILLVLILSALLACCLLAWYIVEIPRLWLRIGTVRSLAVAFAVSLSFFWLGFVGKTFPFAVPADSDPSGVGALQRAAFCGFVLFAVSGLSAPLATGLFGRTALGWMLGVFLLTGLAGASFGLYPSIIEPRYLSSWRLPAQIAGAVVVILGAVVFKSPWLELERDVIEEISE